MSDLEDDVPPVVLPSAAGSLKSVLTELEAERKARKAAEAAKAELVSRFKSYTQDASRQKEEILKQKDEVFRLKEELAKQLSEAIRQREEFAQLRDDAIKSRDDVCRQRDEASKARDSSRSEVEAAARLLVEGAEKITSRISSIKSLPGNLPRSSLHTGVAAIAYGYTKRAEDIVEELSKQLEIAHKSRSELREQMEQHSYQMAIEVSEMEAIIQGLKDDTAQKSVEMEKFKKLAAEKEVRTLEVEQDMSKKLAQATKQLESLQIEAQDAKHKIDKVKDTSLQLTILLSKSNEAITNLADSILSAPLSSINKKLSSPSIPTDAEEVLKNSVSTLKELIDNCSKVGVALREQRDLKIKEIDNLEGKLTRLTTEKEEITNFLRGALANKHDLLGVHDRGIAAEGKENSHTDDRKQGEAIGMASALENEVKRSRQQIFELQQGLAVARGEIEGLRAAKEREGLELEQKASAIQELEEKWRLAEEHTEGLNLDLVTAREEIIRLKEAASKEAEAGGALLEEVERCQEEITALKKQVEHLNVSLEESNGKLQSKEDMTIAAIAARSAAERSLRIADERAVELRERVEELNRQFDALERLGDGRISSGLYNMCWPSQWFHIRPLFSQSNTTTQPSAEMGELFEPLV